MTDADEGRLTYDLYMSISEVKGTRKPDDIMLRLKPYYLIDSKTEYRITFTFIFEKGQDTVQSITFKSYMFDGADFIHGRWEPPIKAIEMPKRENMIDMEFDVSEMRIQTTPITFNISLIVSKDIPEPFHYQPVVIIKTKKGEPIRREFSTYLAPKKSLSGYEFNCYPVIGKESSSFIFNAKFSYSGVKKDVKKDDFITITGFPHPNLFENIKAASGNVSDVKWESVPVEKKPTKSNQEETKQQDLMLQIKIPVTAETKDINIALEFEKRSTISWIDVTPGFWNLTFTFPPSVSVEGKIVPAYNFEKKKSWFEQRGHDLALCLKIEAGSAPDIILDSVWCKGNLAGLEKAVGKKFPESSLKLVAESEIIERDRLFFIFEEGARRPRVKVDSNGVLKIQLGFQDRDSKAVRFLLNSTTPHLVYRVNETFPQETAIDIQP